MQIRNKLPGRFRRLSHKGQVGGMWDEIGRIQFDYVAGRGLTPEMYLLDVGCGSLRGGVHFVRYLEPAHYFGVDASQFLLDAGHGRELRDAGLQHKLPLENLACNSDFTVAAFGQQFDRVLAQSVFTHLPLNDIKLCLTRVADVVRVGGVFHATCFLSPPGHDWDQPLTHQPGGIVTTPASDPYHYVGDDFAHCVAGLPWQLDVIGDWKHPRQQSMLEFTRVETTS